MTITEFLLERIGEIEAKVQEGVDPADIDGDKRRFYSEAAAMRDDWGLWVFHIPPARVLAECSAKRAIVEMCPEVSLAHKGIEVEMGHGEPDPDLGEQILRTLAATYADHPDYQPEWKLDA